MQRVYDGMILYHGSYCEVSEPMLEKCAKRKDFGQGFYLTSSREQATNFIRTSIIKAASGGIIDESQNYGYLSMFILNNPEDLHYHIFEEADSEWLHCIAAHRKRNAFIDIERKMADFDIIVGKIANDQTNATLTAYLAGAFGIIGEEMADDFCIAQLLPQNLRDQFCFKTVQALSHLQFIKGEKIWL